VGALGARTIGVDGGACPRTAFAAATRFAVARARAIAACLASGAGACVPGPSDDGRLARKVARRCSTPPAPLCAALDCGACASAGDLAACLAGAVGAEVDALVTRL